MMPPSSWSGTNMRRLMSSHRAADLVAPPVAIERGDARPEAGDLEDQLGAVELQELDVVRDLEVLPDVPGDGAADVALQVGVVRHPAPRSRVQVELLRFLLAVAAALPREHGALVPGVLGRGARLAEAAVAVHEQRPGDF